MAAKQENSDSIEKINIQNGSIYSERMDDELENQTQNNGLTERPLISEDQQDDEKIKEPEFDRSTQ